jgi:hypothetical protein
MHARVGLAFAISTSNKKAIFQKLIIISTKYKHQQICSPPHHKRHKSWDRLMAFAGGDGQFIKWSLCGSPAR